MPERKGLRFEVYAETKYAPVFDEFDSPTQTHWHWRLVGKGDETYAKSARGFLDEADARSNVAKARKVFKGAGFAKVITVDA